MEVEAETPSPSNDKLIKQPSVQARLTDNGRDMTDTSASRSKEPSTDNQHATNNKEGKIYFGLKEFSHKICLDKESMSFFP